MKQRKTRKSLIVKAELRKLGKSMTRQKVEGIAYYIVDNKKYATVQDVADAFKIKL